MRPVNSAVTIGGWPLLHIAGGFDPVTLQPRVARGIVAIGNIAVGVLAIGGVAVTPALFKELS